MNVKLLNDGRLHILVGSERFEGTWLGPGFVVGAEVRVKILANQHGRQAVRVMWPDAVGGDDKPGVVWSKVS